MTQNNIAPLETTPLIGSECSNMRYGKRSLAFVYPQDHSPNYHLHSQLENGPSCSRPPIYKRSFSAESLLSTDPSNLEHSKPNLLCKCSEQHQPLLSKYEQFHMRKWWVGLKLVNSGTVARDHLASERTFLSYMRTSLALASTGVALVQLFSVASVSSPHTSHRLHIYIRPLGASTIIIGLLVLFIGIMRYFTIQVALTKGFFPVARLATGFVAMMLGVLVTLTFGILMAGKLEPRGRSWSGQPWEKKNRVNFLKLR